MLVRIIAVVAMLVASSASAADIKKNEQYYIGLAYSYMAGTTFDHHSPAPTGRLVNFTSEREEAGVDWGTGGAFRIGYDFKSFLRAEIEYSYHSTELESHSRVAGFNKGKNDIDLHSAGLTLIGELNNNSRFTPYIHGGAGMVLGHVNVQGAGPSQETFSDLVIAPAVSFGAGSTFAINSMFELDVRYRAAVIPTAEDLETAMLVHGVMAGVNFKF
ncbi:MAG: hypothetical protein CMM76_15835 [Rhodospirillaceae bacterium]|nr:hypothetical protein [Rhodospirillaceae bacterium]